MNNRTELTDEDGNIRELQREDFAHMRPAKEVLPELVAAWDKERLKRGRPLAAQTKELISIRLSPEILEKFRQSGRGWQTRMENALKEWLSTHKL